MRRWVILFAFFACCQLAKASDAQWQAVGLASDDLVSGRFLYTPEGRVSVGADVSWLDGVAQDQREGWRVAFVGTYDLLDAVPLKVPVVGEIPATWYIGGLGGVLFADGANADATAALMTGLVLGDGRASIGVEAQYLLTNAFWKPLAPIDDTTRVLFYAALRF